MNRFFGLILFLIIFSCKSPDDNPSPDDGLTGSGLTEINGGQVSTFEFVRLNRDDLFQNEYLGTLGNLQITLTLDSENDELIFQMPQNAPLGENNLIIGDLKLSVKYDIIETVLENEPEIELETLFLEIENFNSVLEDSDSVSKNMKDFINSFNDYFSGATDAEKRELALNYVANKKLYDDAFMNDLASKTNIDGSDLEILGKMVIAAAGFSASLFITLASLPNFVAAAAAALFTYAFYTRLILYKNEFNDRNINVITTVIDDVKALFDKNKNDVIKLTSGIKSTFDLKSERRDFTSEDNDGENNNVSNYFEAIDKANTVVDKFNSAINFIKENLFFSNIQNVSAVAINSENPIQTVLEDEQFFNQINFSIESTNVNIEQISFDNGQLSITAKIVDENSVEEFVDTRINFSYEDDFNRLTGSFPAEIYLENQIDIVGTWILRALGDTTCTNGSAGIGNVSSITINNDGSVTGDGSVTSNNGEVNYVLNGEEINLEISYTYENNFGICEDGTQVSSDISRVYVFNGTFDGNSFVGTLNFTLTWQESCMQFENNECNGGAILFQN